MYKAVQLYNWITYSHDFLLSMCLNIVTVLNLHKKSISTVVFDHNTYGIFYKK